MVQNKIYIVLVTLLFAAFALVLNLFPRSAYSPLEKRELARFPEFSLDSLFSGAFTTSINSWYSDSEPFRDRFMQLSMKEKDLLRVVLGEGKGRNWWCVVFPPVCLAAVQREAVRPVMNPEDYALITREEGWQIRFRIVELWGELIALACAD